MGNLEEKEDVKDIPFAISNIFLDEKMMKFPILKIIYDDCDIKINSKVCQVENEVNNIKDIKNILSKESSFTCSDCKNVISTFDFSIKKELKNIIICNDCFMKLKEKNEDKQNIYFDKFISTCYKHKKNYEIFCFNCNRNMCSECKEEHLELSPKHQLISFNNIVERKELKKKINLCKKVKSLSQVFQNISEIKRFL